VTLSTKIRDARLSAGLTQQDLAEMSGVAQPNIAAYERGARTPSAKMAGRLVAAARPLPSVLARRHKDAIIRLASEHKASDVRVFGSVARGEDGPHSDLDILVTFADGASIYDHGVLIEDLTNLLGCPVDVVSEGGLRAKHDQIRADAIPIEMV
jgi:predicted nucleotidyltransferase